MKEQRQISDGEITSILQKLNAGNREAWADLIPIAYEHLREVARAYVGRERQSTVQPTEIVHETYLRLVRHHSIHWVDRNHFFGVAAHLIRLLLVDKGRSSARRKRLHEGLVQNQTHIVCDARTVEIEVLDAALDRLAELDARQAHIVELRYFAGMTIEETAVLLEIAPRTVKREWTAARAWLFVALQDGSK